MLLTALIGRLKNFTGKPNEIFGVVLGVWRGTGLFLSLPLLTDFKSESTAQAIVFLADQQLDESFPLALSMAGGMVHHFNSKGSLLEINGLQQDCAGSHIARMGNGWVQTSTLGPTC